MSLKKSHDIVHAAPICMAILDLFRGLFGRRATGAASLRCRLGRRCCAASALYTVHELLSKRSQSLLTVRLQQPLESMQDIEVVETEGVSGMLVLWRRGLEFKLEVKSKLKSNQI